MLFIIDADGFKHINGMYGHVAGDMAFRFIGDCKRRSFRAGDVLGRVGGDELTVFVSDINSRRTAQKKAELLQKHLESGLETGVPPLSVSIGVALAPADGNSVSLRGYCNDAEPGYKDYKYFRFKLLTTRSVCGILIINRPGGQ